MYPYDPARYCLKCPVLHIENCDVCYGFGLKKLDSIDGPIPVNGENQRHPEMLNTWYQCPLCEGTPYGIAGLLLRKAE